MTARQGGAPRRPRRHFPLVLLLLLLALPRPAGAQVRPDSTAPDSVPRDTLLVPIPPDAVSPDTLPNDSTPDVARAPVPIFPRYSAPLPTGWSAGRWEWDREALWRYQGFSLLEFLERTPGLTIVRSGDHGQPVGVSALGLGGGRLRVFLDGFELDPLGYTAVDLQQMGTIDLESVRIERDLTGVRIELNTIRLPENRPFSAVEAATGVFQSKLLRGALVRAVGGRSVVTAAYDAVTTEGYRFDFPFAMVNARAAWSYALSDRTAFQAEVRSGGVERVGGRYNENYDRRTILIRGRSELGEGLVVDGALGRAWRKPADGDPIRPELTSVQGMLRASYALSAGWAEASVRLRDEELVASAAPRLEIGARGALRPLAWLSTEGEVRSGRVGGAGALVWQATGRVGRIGAPSLFVSLAGGAQGLGLVEDVDSVPRFTAVSSTVASIRAGAEMNRSAFSFGVAGVGLAPAEIVPFGAAFDRGLPAVEAEGATGVEAHFSAAVPRTRDLVRLEGWANYWPVRGDRPYLPEFDSRAALTAHGVFYDGQLEPTLSFQLSGRGAMRAPVLATGIFEDTTPYVLTNLFIQIRILDVQAFGLWENLFNYQVAADLPDARLPGQRLVYGIRWVFRD